MHIGIYSETAFPKIGGQEIVLDALARTFLALGHRVRLLAPHPGSKHTIRDDLLPYPVDRHPRFISTRYFMDWYGRYLRRQHLRHAFDVVHCHSVYPCGYLAAALKRTSGIPYVLTSHGGDVREGNVRITKPGNRRRHELGIQQADALIAISRFTHDGFLRLGARPDQIAEIPNGVDRERVAASATRPTNLRPDIVPRGYFLFLGRLHSRKGVDVLLRAAATSRRQGDAAGMKIVIAGDGPERATLEQLAVQLGLGDSAIFLGMVAGEEKFYLLQNARALVAPSRVWEGLPLVILEAYAAGCGIIGSDTPGVADMIRPGQTGAIVPAESVDALSRALSAAWAHSDSCRHWGENARQWSFEFDWKNVAARHLQLFERVIHSRSAACGASNLSENAA